MLANVELFPNKFQQDILRTLRLSFTTSQLLMQHGGRQFVDGSDFKRPIDPENERMSLDFLIQHLEGLLAKFRPAEAYQSVIDELKVESKQQYDRLNIHRL